MEEAASNNATLMHRILQLEQERDELQLDIQQLCLKQSGVSGSVDIFNRIQTRKITCLDLELETCKQKLALFTRENHKLQEELSEVYHIKGQFADLLKVETEKNHEVEKEVHFFQRKISSALQERDRALLEVETSHGKEQAMIVKMNQLRDRLDQIMSDCLEQKRHCDTLQKNLERRNEECGIFQKVVDLFWEMRCKVHGFDNETVPMDRAAILIEESGNCWVYRGTNKALEDGDGQAEKVEATLALLQEDFHFSVNSVASLQRQLEEVYMSQRHADEQGLLHRNKMLHLAGVITAKVRAVQATKITLREDLVAMAKEAGNFASSLSETLQAILNGAKTLASPIKIREKGVRLQVLEPNEEESIGIREPYATKEVFCGGSLDKENDIDIEPSSRPENDMKLDDSKAALTRALQEKEERYILEENTTAAMEYQISELNQQLSQVTSEKVKALVDLAHLREELQTRQEQESELNQMLQQHRGTSVSSRLLPALWTDGALPEYLKNATNYNTYHPTRRRMSPRQYLTYWLRGFSTTSNGQFFVATGDKEGALGIARCGRSIHKFKTHVIFFSCIYKSLIPSSIKDWSLL